VGSIVNGLPSNGAIAILIYPQGGTGNVTINNITAIVPAELQRLNCEQRALIAHEINISGNAIINYCMNYAGKTEGLSEQTLSVWQYSNGLWQELPADEVAQNASVICGNIAPSNTPYMIAGFTSVQAAITAETALATIRNANATIVQAMADGKDITEAQALLTQAIAAYSDCSYEDASKLADKAIGMLQASVGLIALAAGAVVLIVGGLAYWMLKIRVKPKFKSSYRPRRK